MTEEQKLKDCPHCGSDKTELCHLDAHWRPYRHRWVAVCKTCGTTSGHQIAEQAATDTWNARV